VGRRLISFRLSDLPERVLLHGKDVAMRREDSPFKRLEIAQAAERPSEHVYWVPRDAWERVMG
jgi:hypothetical protein